jgi:DNA-binding PucR family transcriptional regulator
MELIRAAATRILADPQQLFDEIEAALLTGRSGPHADDPALVAALRATNRANLAQWATANMRSPGSPVPPNLGPDVLEISREVVRRGLDDTSFNDYRIGQDVAWRHWMRTAFELSEDHDQLREMLDVSARSISSYVEATLAGMHEEIERERERLRTRTHAERLEVVNLILEGAPIASQRASNRLRYELARRHHTAAIVWSDGSPPADRRVLEALAEELSRSAGASRPLTVPSSAASLWIWFATAEAIETEQATAGLTLPAGVRIALGMPGSGIDGFRRSHLEAIATQRLMRRAPTGEAVATFADVQLVVLATRDEDHASEFVTRTLGPLASADPELRNTLRLYAREQFSAARAGRLLYTHRNTILNRVARASAMLPVPLAEHGLEVGLALEILHWLGAPSAAGARAAAAG